MSLKPPSLPDLISKPSPNTYSPNQTHDRSMFFRSEYDGILIYDFNSRLSTTLTENSEITPETLTSKPKIKGISDYGKNQIDRQQFESMKSYSAQRQYFPQYTLVVPKDNVLVFDSRFESGNLHKAIKVSENEYNLLLNYDTETLGHTQWYYFSVRNYKKNHAVRFNIINLMKFESLYSEGMKPAVLSMEKKRRTGIEWHQDGYNLGYYQNNYKRSVVLPGCQEKSKYYYTLTFTYKFEHYPDTVYFSYSYPYTYSDLSAYLLSLSTNPNYQKFLRINPICKSLAGNPCYSLTITNKIKSYTDWKDENDKLNKSSAARRHLKIREIKEEGKLRYHEGKLTEEDMVHSSKKGVILTARVHPGEPNASYMIRGAIEFLLSNCKEAKMLRKKIVFKVVPMLNPDGVIYGNYRCSLLGVDLNRRWKHPNAVMHPTIFYCKRMIQVFCEEREVALFADFHGHSIKKEVFAYACCYKRCDVYRVKENLLIRLVPYLMSKENKFFSYEDSHFRVERSKMGTGRVVNFKENKILTSYTIEASFFGSSSSSSHFSIEDLEKIGRDLCSICSVFYSKREFTSKITELTNHIANSPQFKSDIKQSEKMSKSQNDTIKAPNVLETIPEEHNEPNFSIKDQLKQLSSLETIDFLIEEEEDSGGSESDASMNDDKKIMFTLKSNKKHKNRPKHSQSPRRTSQVQQNSSFTNIKSSITPEALIKFRPKSRSSIKRSNKIPIKQIIPNKIIVNSPFIEDNHETNSIIIKSTKSKDSTPLKPIRKLDDILRDLGLSETPLSYKSIKKKP